MSAEERVGRRLADGLISFTFDGRSYRARPGDTVASALLANGEHLLGRSLKYHRPRGLTTASFEEPCALLTVGDGTNVIPNVPATQIPVCEGLRVRSQNRWPSLRHDLGAALKLFGPLLGAGFYYRTFIWPGWTAYEGVIRRLAGLGPAPRACTLDAPAVEHFSCDVLIVGAGPAGLSAALLASRAGAQTVLIEQAPVAGGELEFEDATVEGLRALDWVEATLEELRDRGVRVLLNTAVVGNAGRQVIAHGDAVASAARPGVFRITAGSLVMACGATEQPPVFEANDTPGVMLLGAAERYLAAYGVRVGERAVLFGCHDRLYASARRLLDSGIDIGAIIDTRGTVRSPLVMDLVSRGVDCLRGHAVLRALGGARLTGVVVAPLENPRLTQELRCDSLLVSATWRAGSLVAELAQAGLQEDGSEGWLYAAGSANGCFELGEALRDGHRAGEAAVRRSGMEVATVSGEPMTSPAVPSGSGDGAPCMQPLWRSPSTSRGEHRQFVDLQNDVTVADLRQCVEQGLIDIEHVKRFTTLGVGTEQGEISGLPGAAILAELKGEDSLSPTLSRRRQPVRPVTVTTLAGVRRGNLLRPARHTPLHEWHRDNEAVLEDAGQWMRPRYYRTNGSDPESAGFVEAARVREHGGIVDVSTLGKLEVAGPDAVAFLDRLYLNRASTIKPGRSKYMVLLREDGMVLDDGIVLRLAEDRFIATISSGHAEHVLSHMALWRAREMYGLRVTLTDVTEAWAAIAVSGPASRDALKSLLGEEWAVPLSTMPHMAFHTGVWRGIEVRVLRASFTGECAFELHCRCPAALPLWSGLVQAGLQPYGLEALDILRIEKGYLTSAELNGQTSPFDLGLTRMVELGNECVGRALLDRPGLHEAHRQRLVGLQAADPGDPLHAGAQLTSRSSCNVARGYVTSAANSPALGRYIALALMERDYAALGTDLVLKHPLSDFETSVRVVAPTHFDPEGTRMKTP